MVPTICRVASVNLTDQTGPKTVEMSAKTGTYKKKMTQYFDTENKIFKMSAYLEEMKI